jgi:uncharacterized protein (TIGR02757 family)
MEWIVRKKNTNKTGEQFLKSITLKNNNILDLVDLKLFLDEKFIYYNRHFFIEHDPISIPHLFSKKEDIEIAAFLTAIIAWGQRTTIIANAHKLMKWMDDEPFAFVMNAKKQDLKPLEKFVHRTFNGTDLFFFLRSLKNIYTQHGGLQKAFTLSDVSNIRANEYLLQSLVQFRKLFFEIDYPERSAKHISNPAENSAAKRLCMFLRWMVREDKNGVDFGIWKDNFLTPAVLMCPLDIHSGNVARKLNLLNRKQNDWKAVTELSINLRKLDARDPVKYDFALFGLGAFEKF